MELVDPNVPPANPLSYFQVSFAVPPCNFFPSTILEIHENTGSDDVTFGLEKDIYIYHFKTWFIILMCSKCE